MCGDSNASTVANGDSNSQPNTDGNIDTQAKRNAQSYCNSALDSDSAVSLGAVRSIFGNSRGDLLVLKKAAIFCADSDATGP